MKKRIIGFKTKRIIDFCRIKYIEKMAPNLNVGAHMYCDPIRESPESTLIVAWKT